MAVMGKVLVVLFCRRQPASSPEDWAIPVAPSYDTVN